MLRLGKPVAAHTPAGSGSPGGVQGGSRRTDCSGAEGNGEVLVPLLLAGQAGRAGRAVLPALLLTLPLYSPDNTGIKITRLHLQ